MHTQPLPFANGAQGKRAGLNNAAPPVLESTHVLSFLSGGSIVPEQRLRVRCGHRPRIHDERAEKEATRYSRFERGRRQRGAWVRDVLRFFPSALRVQKCEPSEGRSTRNTPPFTKARASGMSSVSNVGLYAKSFATRMNSPNGAHGLFLTGLF